MEPGTLICNKGREKICFGFASHAVSLAFKAQKLQRQWACVRPCPGELHTEANFQLSMISVGPKLWSSLSCLKILTFSAHLIQNVVVGEACTVKRNKRVCFLRTESNPSGQLTGSLSLHRA